MEIFFLVGEEPAGFHLVVDPPGFEEGMEGGRLVIVYVDRIEWMKLLIFISLFVWSLQFVS